MIEEVHEGNWDLSANKHSNSLPAVSAAKNEFCSGANDMLTNTSRTAEQQTTQVHFIDMQRKMTSVYTANSQFISLDDHNSIVFIEN